ncbi:unnamed protein product [Rotaria sordida]|uniref:Uncharacterized protein n=1 Tax=Rotaria sordida TaxID=392033 RepID=A0A814UW65_9BILA|nr:unnamed protein product [Rotaria sordida]
MNIIWNFLLLVLIADYSYGRYTVRWIRTNDQTLIDECLEKSLKHMNLGEDITVLQSKVSNIICKTRFLNGINIKLYFELEQQKWKCLLYKPLVETLGIQYERCMQPQDDDSLEEGQSKQSNQIIQEEPQVNNDNKVEEEPQVNNDNRVEEEEEDDEAKIDALNEQERKKEIKNDETEIDNRNQPISNEDTNNQQGSEQNADRNEKISNDQVENENMNNDETNLDTHNSEQKKNNDEEISNKDVDNDNTNVQDNNQQEQPENINNQEVMPQ